MNSNMKGWQMSIVASFLFYEGEFESCIQEGDLFICKGWMFRYSNHPLHIALRHSQILNVEASQHLFFSSRTRCHLRFAGGKWLRWVGYLSLFRSSNQHRATSNRDNRGVDQSIVEQHAQFTYIYIDYLPSRELSSPQAFLKMMLFPGRYVAFATKTEGHNSSRFPALPQEKGKPFYLYTGRGPSSAVSRWQIEGSIMGLA